mmetsp:Transcript_24449/g.55147  ORF Transcript_24449/g.55147 Transcript_24449/m.55147 type:complete len:87 (+) Transcript_24449:573-833(+)
MTSREWRALVKATFIRRTSSRNPTPLTTTSQDRYAMSRTPGVRSDAREDDDVSLLPLTRVDGHDVDVVPSGLGIASFNRLRDGMWT